MEWPGCCDRKKTFPLLNTLHSQQAFASLPLLFQSIHDQNKLLSLQCAPSYVCIQARHPTLSCDTQPKQIALIAGAFCIPTNQCYDHITLAFIPAESIRWDFTLLAVLRWLRIFYSYTIIMHSPQLQHDLHSNPKTTFSNTTAKKLPTAATLSLCPPTSSKSQLLHRPLSQIQPPLPQYPAKHRSK